MSRVSGWCSDYRGECTSPGFHGICQERIENGQLDGCGCTANGGHQSQLPPISVGGICDNETRPQGAGTPAASNPSSILETNGG